MTTSLHLPAADFHRLFEQLGPSLGLWRAAEIAALRLVPYQPPVLDLGCGDGLVTSYVLPRIEIGLDPDRIALRHAARRGIYQSLLPGQAEALMLPPNSVGTVVSNSVLEHLPQLNSVLGWVARVLRPGGRLVFTVPTAAFSRQLALPLRRYTAWRNQQLGHVNLWSADEWLRRLQCVGLDVVQIRPYLRPALVRLWDALELLQLLWIGRRRLFGLVWHALPAAALTRLAAWSGTLDLSSRSPGGGQLLIAEKGR